METGNRPALAGPDIENPWIVRGLRRPDAPLRLFCLPHAGGSAAMFYAWAGPLPETIEVIGLQAPGRGRRVRETPFTRMAPLVESVREAVLPLLDRPYALFGQSLGALAGFELARRLSEAGKPPVHLLVSACSAPHLHAPEVLHSLPDPEFRAALARFEGTPREVLAHEELMQQLLPILRADFAVSETYHYAEGEPLACPITVFGGVADPIVPTQNLEGWREHTVAAFEQVMFQGGHFYLQEARGALLQRVAHLFNVQR